MNKQPEKTAQTKEALTNAFWKLYKDKPITKITVKDVTDGAGFYRSTFYFYFTDVYNILEQIEDNILLNWEANASEVLESGNRDGLLKMVTEFYKQYGEYMSVLLSPNGDPNFLQKIKNVMRPKMFSVLQTSPDNWKSSLIFEFIISAMLAYLTEWYKNERHIPAEEAVKLLRSLASENILLAMHQHSFIKN